MKTPTLEEVKEYFKDADKIQSIIGRKFKNDGKFRGSKYAMDGDTSIYAKNGKYEVWNQLRGYAKILSYKEPKEKTYKITREQIYKLFNTYGNDKNDLLKKYFSEVFETKLEVGKWYKYKTNYFNWIMCYTGIDGKNFGFNTSGTFGTDFEMDLKTEWKEATEQEVEEALTKEAVKRGLVIGSYASFGTIKEVRKITDEIIWNERHKCLSSGKNVLMDSKAVWVESVPTLTKQEAEAKLKEIGVNAKIV